MANQASAARNDLFSFMFGNAWAFADRVFKLLTWIIALGLVRAIGEKAGIPGTLSITTFLTALWLLAALVSIFECATAIQDHFHGTIAAWPVWFRFGAAAVLAMALGAGVTRVLQVVIGFFFQLLPAASAIR